MNYKTFNRGPSRARGTPAVLPTRLRAKMSRAGRGSAFIDGALLITVVLTALCIFAQHNPSMSASFSQLGNSFNFHVIHFVSWVEGMYRTNANNLNNIGH